MSRSRGTGNVTEVTGEDNHVDWSDPEIWTMIDDNNQTLVGDGEMQTSRKMGWKCEWEMGPEIELDREAA